MIKKVLLLIIALLPVVGITGCYKSSPAYKMPPIIIPAASATQLLPEHVYINAFSEKDEYLPGEETAVTLSFTCISDTPYEIAPFPPQVEIRGGDNHTIRTYPAGQSEVTLQPGETIEYILVWDQCNEQGQSVPYGHYRFFIPDYVRIYSSLGSVYILPEEGVIEKTVLINESQTVDEITFILERVDFTPEGIRFQVLNSGYYGYPLSCHAEYRIDDGPVREQENVDSIGGGTGIDGTEYMWTMDIPVPKSTEELEFTIKSFGETEGPWKFTILLK
jgi:hypothetical protein